LGGDFLSNVENILLNGPQLILNEVFRLSGFDAIDDEILKQLAVARLCQPSSKTGTVDYLKSHFDDDVLLYKIYRYLGKLNSTQKEAIQQISVGHTRKILGGRISQENRIFNEFTQVFGKNYFLLDNSEKNVTIF